MNFWILFSLFFVLSSAQFIPTTETFDCFQYESSDECNMYIEYGCVWCENLSSCGTCDPCTSELYVGSKVCSGDYSSQCYSLPKCIVIETVTYSLLCLFVLLVICCLIVCMLPLYQRKTFGSNILVVILGIIAFIGILLLIATFVAFVVSLFTVSKENTLFKNIVWSMMIYVTVAFLIVCFFCIILVTVIGFIHLCKKINTSKSYDDIFEL